MFVNRLERRWQRRGSFRPPTARRGGRGGGVTRGRPRPGALPVLVLLVRGQASFDAIRLSRACAVVDGSLLTAFVGCWVELAGCGHWRIVRRVLRWPGLMQRVVVMVLAGGVRWHTQPQRKPVSSCSLVMVTTGTSCRLVMVTPVEARLLKVWVHGSGMRKVIAKIWTDSRHVTAQHFSLGPDEEVT